MKPKARRNIRRGIGITAAVMLGWGAIKGAKSFVAERKHNQKIVQEARKFIPKDTVGVYEIYMKKGMSHMSNSHVKTLEFISKNSKRLGVTPERFVLTLVKNPVGDKNIRTQISQLNNKIKSLEKNRSLRHQDLSEYIARRKRIVNVLKSVLKVRDPEVKKTIRWMSTQKVGSKLDKN